MQSSLRKTSRLKKWQLLLLPTGFCSHSSFKLCLCKRPLAQNKSRNKPVEEIISSTDWFLLPFLIQALSMQASPGKTSAATSRSKISLISSTDWLRQLAMGSSFWRLGRKDMETQSSLRIPAGYTPQAGLGFHYRSFSLPATAAHLSCNRNPWPKGRVTT